MTLKESESADWVAHFSGRIVIQGVMNLPTLRPSTFLKYKVNPPIVAKLKSLLEKLLTYAIKIQEFFIAEYEANSV